MNNLPASTLICKYRYFPTSPNCFPSSGRTILLIAAIVPLTDNTRFPNCESCSVATSPLHCDEGNGCVYSCNDLNKLKYGCCQTEIQQR